MRASASPASATPSASPGGGSSAQRAQALLAAAPPVYTLRKRARTGSMVEESPERDDGEEEHAMDIDGDKEGEDEVAVATLTSKRRGSTSKFSPTSASPPPPPGSTRQLRPRSASATPGPSNKKPSATAAITAAASTSPSSSPRRARTTRRASLASDSSLTSLSDLDEEDEEDEDEEDDDEGENAEASGADTNALSSTATRRDSIVQGIARTPAGKKPSSQTAIAVVKAAKVAKSKSRMGKKRAGKGAAPGKSGKKVAPQAEKGKGGKPTRATRRTVPPVKAPASSVNGIFPSSESDAAADADEELDDDLPAGDEAYDPSLSVSDQEADTELEDDDDFDPSYPEKGAPKPGGYNKKGGGAVGDKKGKGKGKAQARSPKALSGSSLGGAGRRTSVAERARERARAMEMGPNGEVVDVGAVFIGSSPPTRSTKSTKVTKKTPGSKQNSGPSAPLICPPDGAGPRIDTGFKPPAMPKVQELWERCEEIVQTARLEAGRDQKLQTRCEQAIESALELLPAGDQQTALCMMMNRYSAFCGHPAVDIPVFPLTNPKLLLFFSRVPYTPLSWSILSRFPQPDPLQSYALPLAGYLDPNLTTEEGRYVTQELVASWVDAMGYAQMATREVWEEVFDPVRGEERKRDVGLDPAQLLSSSAAVDGDGEGGGLEDAAHPALRKIQGDEAMKEILRAVESVESIRAWEAKMALQAQAEEEEEEGRRRKGKGKGREGTEEDGTVDADGGPERKRTKWTKGGKSVLGPSPVGVRTSSSTSNLSAQMRQNGSTSSPSAGLPALGSDVVTSTPQDPLLGPSASPSISHTIPRVNGRVWDVQPDTSFPRVDRLVQPSPSTSAVLPAAETLQRNEASALMSNPRQPVRRTSGTIGGFGGVMAPLAGFGQRAPSFASSGHAQLFDSSVVRGQPVYVQPPPPSNGTAPYPGRMSSTSLLDAGVESLSVSPRRGVPGPMPPYEDEWEGVRQQGGGERLHGSYGSGYGYPPSRLLNPSDRAHPAGNTDRRTSFPYRSTMQPLPPSTSYDYSPRSSRPQFFGPSSFGSPAFDQGVSTSNAALERQATLRASQQQPPASYAGEASRQPRSRMESAPATMASVSTPMEPESQSKTTAMSDLSGQAMQAPTVKGQGMNETGSTSMQREQQQEPLLAQQCFAVDPSQPRLVSTAATADVAPVQIQHTACDGGEAQLDPGQVALAALLESAEASKLAEDANRSAPVPQEVQNTVPAANLLNEPPSAPAGTLSASLHVQQEKDQQLLDAISSVLPQGGTQHDQQASGQEMPPPPVPSSATGHFRSQTSYDPPFSTTASSHAMYTGDQREQRYYPREVQSFQARSRQSSAPAHLPQAGASHGGYNQRLLPFDPSSTGGGGLYGPGYADGYGYGGPSASSAYPHRQPVQFRSRPTYPVDELEHFPSHRVRQSTHPNTQYGTEYDQFSHLPTPPLYQSRQFDPYGALSAHDGYNTGFDGGEYEYIPPRGQPIYARRPPTAHVNSTSTDGWLASSSSLPTTTSASGSFATQAYPTPDSPANARFAGPSMSGPGGAGPSNGYGLDLAAQQYSMAGDDGAQSTTVGLGIEMR
ncbi:hypothetical protein JCM11251_005378 [Rhodosporidiobolus azoricus]